LSGDDPKPPFLALAKRLRQFPVRFDATGMFLSARGPSYSDDTVVLFLSPKPSELLLEAHRVASEVLRGWNEGRWSHYRPERWVPPLHIGRAPSEGPHLGGTQCSLG
jgi:hypothetical protein